MIRYRTEILIPGDRVVTLHLPESLREGRAQVTIEVLEPALGEDAVDDEPDSAHDIEWWEEFGDEPTAEEPWGLRTRLSSLEA